MLTTKNWIETSDTNHHILRGVTLADDKTIGRSVMRLVVR
jgi:hypothetical protein